MYLGKLASTTGKEKGPTIILVVGVYFGSCRFRYLTLKRLKSEIRFYIKSRSMNTILYEEEESLPKTQNTL